MNIFFSRAGLAGIALSLTMCANVPQSTSRAANQPVAAADEAPSIAAPRCNDGKPHPNAPEELAQFAFLIGDYDITGHAWTGTGWSPPRPGPHSRWNGWYGLGGMAIYDEWYAPDPGIDPDAPRGVNVRFYDSSASEWKMMWVSTGTGQVQDLRAEMRDGKLTMWQVYPDRPGFLADFTIVDEDHWYRTGYGKDEQGEWVPQFKLAATRIPCD